MRTTLLLGAIGLGLLTAASSGALADHPSIWTDMGGGSGGGAPSLSAPYTELRSLAALSPVDIWAVGVNRTPSGEEPRIQHWDGASWAVAPVARTQAQAELFNGVAATSPSNVWAVGYSGGIDGLQEGTLVEHWDGHAWSLVASPNPTHAWNELDAVVALSPTDAWAVGYAKHDFWRAEALVEHWNGTSWDWIPVPSPGKNWNQLAAVVARGPHDIWAVGWQQDDGPRTALVEPWDGAGWSVVPIDTALGSKGLAQEFRAAAIGGDQFWAASPTATVRWDGHGWVTDRRRSPAEIWAASASAANDAWVVGAVPTSGGERTLLERWDGTTWSAVASPGGVSLGRLTGVIALSSRDVWIVGTRQGVQPSTLTEHWDGTAWSIVSSPD